MTNSQVELITIRDLGHRYPSGPTGTRSYGVDMTTLTWSAMPTIM